MVLSCFVRYGNVQYGYGKVCFDDGGRNNSCSILVSRRQRAVYFDIGFVSDKFGRKITIIAMSCSALACYLLFILSGMFKWTPYLTGFAIGGFMGSYWGAGDTIGGIMFSESSPTNLRSSVTVINTLLNGVMGGLATVITMILLPIIPEKMFGYMYLGLTVPGLVGAIVIMWLFVGETRGLDLKTVTGTEWDKPKKLNKKHRTVNKMDNKYFELGANEQPLDIIKETCGLQAYSNK